MDFKKLKIIKKRKEKKMEEERKKGGKGTAKAQYRGRGLSQQ